MIPEVRYPRSPSALTVSAVILRPLRELLLRCLRHLDAVETGASSLWSPELQALMLRLIRIERLLVLARGFPIARDLHVERERLQTAFREEVMRVLARGECDGL